LSNEYEERVAGVTLQFSQSELMGAHGDTRRIRLVLECTITDEEMWKEVEGKFREGHRMFKDPDFHSEVASMMHEDVKDLAARNTQLEKELRMAKEAVRELLRHRAALCELGQAIAAMPLVR